VDEKRFYAIDRPGLWNFSAKDGFRHGVKIGTLWREGGLWDLNGERDRCVPIMHAIRLGRAGRAIFQLVRVHEFPCFVPWYGVKSGGGEDVADILIAGDHLRYHFGCLPESNARAEFLGHAVEFFAD